MRNRRIEQHRPSDHLESHENPPILDGYRVTRKIGYTALGVEYAVTPIEPEFSIERITVPFSTPTDHGPLTATVGPAGPIIDEIARGATTQNCEVPVLDVGQQPDRQFVLVQPRKIMTLFEFHNSSQETSSIPIAVLACKTMLGLLSAGLAFPSFSSTDIVQIENRSWHTCGFSRAVRANIRSSRQTLYSLNVVLSRVADDVVPVSSLQHSSGGLLCTNIDEIIEPEDFTNSISRVLTSWKSVVPVPYSRARAVRERLLPSKIDTRSTRLTARISAPKVSIDRQEPTHLTRRSARMSHSRIAFWSLSKPIAFSVIFTIAMVGALGYVLMTGN